METLSPAEQRQVPNKGRQTRAAILDAALGLASHMGLEGLSIGALADLMGMSKSGVFAHFGSREELHDDPVHPTGEVPRPRGAVRAGETADLGSEGLHGP